MENTQLQIQEALQSPRKTNKKKFTTWHIMGKLIRIKYEEINIKSNNEKKKEYHQRSDSKLTMKAQRQLRDNLQSAEEKSLPT